MFDTLKRLIAGPDPLLKAIDSGDRGRVRYILARRRLSVVGEPNSEGLDPDLATEEQMLEQVERDVAAMNSMSDIVPKSIQRDGQLLFLAFTHPRYLESYCVNEVQKLDRVVGVPAYEIGGAVLVEQLGAGASIVFNVDSRDERILATDDLFAKQSD
ncbi:MAG: hypothetical protein AAFU85_23410 [Planctomycetota bacterium]